MTHREYSPIDGSRTWTAGNQTAELEQEDLLSHLSHQHGNSPFPHVFLYPGEEYNPENPSNFIQQSRFRHHRGGIDDEGYQKTTGTTGNWVTSNSHDPAYYDIPVSFINKYSLNADGTNRRPRDPNAGSSWNVFLQTRTKLTGFSDPNEVVMVFVTPLVPTDGSSLRAMQVWWFHGYNDAVTKFADHQGDWEHSTSVGTFSEESGYVLVGAYLSAHGVSQYFLKDQLEMHDGHYVVYSAKGSHASYPKEGTFNHGWDKTARGGVIWKTEANYQPLGFQPWKDFAGAWGEVGLRADTTGPLGPWYKRYE
jgi:hypothetical protein